MLNTVDLPAHRMSEKFVLLSVAPVFAEAIRRIYECVSVSKLFEE